MRSDFGATSRFRAERQRSRLNAAVNSVSAGPAAPRRRRGYGECLPERQPSFRWSAREIQRMRSGRLSAVAEPAALRAVTLHWTLRPRSLRLMPSVRRRAPRFRLPFTNQR